MEQSKVCGQAAVPGPVLPFGETRSHASKVHAATKSQILCIEFQQRLNKQWLKTRLSEAFFMLCCFHGSKLVLLEVTTVYKKEKVLIKCQQIIKHKPVILFFMLILKQFKDCRIFISDTYVVVF